jgi:uncharacterized protein (DUF736 family)
MAIIGTFTAADNGYTGSVRTLTLNLKVKFVATEKDNDKAPDFRIFSGATECGAVWKKTVRDSDREYLSVKLDDPSFPAPIYASLGERRGQRQQLRADLVPPQQRMTRRDRRAPPPRRRGFFCAHDHNAPVRSGRRPSASLFAGRLLRAPSSRAQG